MCKLQNKGRSYTNPSDNKSTYIHFNPLRARSEAGLMHLQNLIENRSVMLVTSIAPFTNCCVRRVAFEFAAKQCYRKTWKFVKFILIVYTE